MPVRVHLTLLYLALFTAAFLMLAVLLHVLFTRSLSVQLDESILTEARGIGSLLQGDVAAGKLPSGVATGDPTTPQNSENEPESFEHIEAMHLVDPNLHFEMLDPQGRLVANSNNLANSRLWSGAPPSAHAGSFGVYASSQLGPLRRYVLPVATPAGVWTVIGAGPLRPIQTTVDTLHRLLWTSLPLLLTVVGVLGYSLAAHALRPVAAITATAQSIREGDLSGRIALTGPRDELKHLADTFDAMIGSLDQLVRTQRQFLADASHDLRTPLTVICAALESTQRNRNADVRQLREVSAIVYQEARGMQRLVEDLLTLARADAGQIPLQLAPVQLDDVVKEACEAAAWLLQGRPLHVNLPHEVSVTADAGRLHQLVLNLLVNAAQHTPVGGAVSVELREQAGRVLLSVRDDGPGISPEHLPHLFDRFYRGDDARTGTGSGLGLPICRWIAQAHGGTLEVQSEPGRGTTFTCDLPATAVSN